MIAKVVRNAVCARAENRCEYCHLNQEDEPFLRYQVEHIIAIQHGGETELDNLALACPHCNLHKGPNLAGIDPETQLLAPLFHPRKDRWEEHFEMDDTRIVGLTSIGRTTVRVLAMNMGVRQEFRKNTIQ